MEQIRPGLLPFLYPLFAVTIILLSAWILHEKNAYEILKIQKAKGYGRGFAILLALGFAWAVISLTQVSTFLYFNF